MIIVDTSVLIDYLKGTANRSTGIFDRVLETGIPFGINEYIYLELLQGARTVEEFGKLNEYLETVPCYSLVNGKASFEKAAYLSMQCRRSGITVRSTIDVLIVQTAIEHNLFLLHNDKDFNKISTVIRELKIYHPD